MTIKNRLRMVLALIALLAASLMVLLVAEEPAHAAFPGKNGKIAFVNGGDIWTMNPDATEQTNLTNSPEEPDSDPTFSPDGKKIAFSKEDAESSTDAVYVMDADGSHATRLAPGRAPAFSPDGEKIVYTVRNQDNTAHDIYMMKADGTGRTKITDGSASAFDPAFSPDGTEIAYAEYENGPLGNVSSISVANADGSEPAKLISSEGYQQGYSSPDWSPDGSRIAFAHTEAVGGNVGQEVYVMNANGSEPTRVADGYGSGYLAFSPDGQKIAFSSRSGNYETDDSGIYTINPDGSEKTQILAGRSYVTDWGVEPNSAVDTTKPRIFNLSPEPRSSVGKTDPSVKATVKDNLAELSEADVRLFVNGKEVPETEFSYDGEEDLLKYQPSKLPKGKNKVKVVAKDEAGNVGSRSWEFTVK